MPVIDSGYVPVAESRPARAYVAGWAYSNDDLRQLLAALVAFADQEMDQFALWRLGTKYGDVFVTISRHPEPGATADAYDVLHPNMPLRGDG